MKGPLYVAMNVQIVVESVIMEIHVPAALIEMNCLLTYPLRIFSDNSAIVTGNC